MSKLSLRIVFGNSSGFNARMGLGMAWKLSLRIVFGNSSGLNARMELRIAWKRYKFEGVVAQVNQTDRFALYLDIRVDSMLEWGS
ncbi:hypothetical protein G2W53_004378 [Senna tora]|uniref:Uncharacterized protein n=1 Tax=Senna tora TaxID=362788 RepID=A0A834XBJ8_9FABA|nr:hypothetical protein G2W53_004378 [Senna tora]